MFDCVGGGELNITFLKNSNGHIKCLTNNPIILLQIPISCSIIEISQICSYEYFNKIHFFMQLFNLFNKHSAIKKSNSVSISIEFSCFII